MSSSEPLLTVDRRTTLKWVCTAVFAANVGAASPARKMAAAVPGYGTDPDLTDPGVPWPRTFSRDQLRLTAGLCDLMLPDDGRSPAASAVGVHDFVDEWVSAPYPQQREDRRVLLQGFDWIQREASRHVSQLFHEASREQQVALFERLIGKRQPAAGFEAAATFFPRLRYIALGAYYTSEAGLADLSYIGNQPIAGDYPGPTPEAREHLRQVLDRLKLPF